jgi:hypothetical protein
MRTISETDPVPTPRWLRGPWRYAAALLGVAFFFAPTTARLVGVQPKQIENRPLVAFPSLNRGFTVFSDLTQWSIDHLPLRNLAVKANARLSEKLFGEAPTYTVAGGPVGLGQAPTLAGATAETGSSGPRVIAGRGGWLFLSEEFNRGCNPTLSLAQVTDGIRRLDAMLTASGRRVVITIAPDKDTVEPSFVPDQVANGDCARRAKQRLWAKLRSLSVPDFVDLLTPLQQLQTATGGPVYLPVDSHWNSRAAATVFVKGLLDGLSPRLYQSARVSPAGPVSYIGDLSVLAGNPQRSTDVQWSVRRAGVVPGPVSTETPFRGFVISSYRNQSRPGVPLVRGRTVIYGDSFLGRALDSLPQFFADATRIPEVSRGAVSGKRREAIARLTNALTSADVVVVEQTERIVAGSSIGSILAPDVLDAIQAALAAAPRGHGLVVK